MVMQQPKLDVESLVAYLATTDDPDARARALEQVRDPETAGEVAERLKNEADRTLYQDATLSARWCGDIVTLGRLVRVPTIVALGRMAEAATLYHQGRYRDALAVFDEASALFRAHGDETGWARTQIGRIVTCRTLATRFDEALEWAPEARSILERAGDTMHAASIDNNLALLLDRMNRPTEALAYNERALAVYRTQGSRYYAAATLTNHAHLLWRLGRVREALQAQQDVRQAYAELGAAVDAARQDLNLGAAHLSLGHYAEAVRLLTIARHDLLELGSSVTAAEAGLHLAEAFVRLGRFSQAVEVAVAVRDEFARGDVLVEQVRAQVWEAAAHAGLRDDGAALGALDAGAALLMEAEELAPQRAILDVSRAQLLLTAGRVVEAGTLLDAAIPILSEAGLTMEVAAAQAIWGDMLMRNGQPAEADAIGAEILGVAGREGVDWLAARALHVRGRAAMHLGDSAAARDWLAAAVRYLDQAHRYIAWDDRVTFSGNAVAIYADAVALAVEQGRPAVALRYAERSKASALADHVRAHIDVRPRARDAYSSALLAELEGLRERYAWLSTAHGKESAGMADRIGALRWGGSPALEAGERAEMARIEGRMAEIWRELQVHNPAYYGDAAALDLTAEGDGEVGDDAAAQRWVRSVQQALGSGDRVALLEYLALGDDLMLFVLRAGTVHTLRLPGASAAVARLVPAMRLQVEACAALVSRDDTVRSIGHSMRGLLRRLHAALLAPAEAHLDGATLLVVVPHGAAHHVPFHALYDGRQYLIERAEVAYAPCATLIEHFERRHRLACAASEGHDCGALVLACSGDGALPHVVDEGRAVVAALGGRLLQEEEATIEAVRAGAKGWRVLHLAAHGVFRPDEPLFSALHLSDGHMSTLDVFDLDLTCSLATLSACETALGVAGAGDELIGLSRAFLYAGASSLLLSLWKVEDRSATALMERFYQALRGGESKAAALRRAQLALLRGETGAGAEWGAPFFWAPFQLIGHPGFLTHPSRA